MALGKISTTVFGLLATAVVAPIASASADSGSAADIVAMLQGQGYSVQFNMPSEMAL